MVPKCKMESVVDAGYRVVAGLSLEQALLLPLQTEAGQHEARPGSASQVGARQSQAAVLGRSPSHPREVREELRDLPPTEKERGRLVHA